MATGKQARSVFSWLVFLASGCVAGVWLGNVIISDLHSSTFNASTTYTDLSGNPDALSVDSHPVERCDNCADSYGSAGFVSKDYGHDRDEHYRELGRVSIEDAGVDPYGENYHYGGNFTNAPPYDSEQSASDPAKGDISSRNAPRPKDEGRPEKAPDVAPLDRTATPLIY